MNDITTARSARWRALRADEVAAAPEARLGGELAIIFWCATALVAWLVLLLGWVIVFSDFFATTMVSGMLFGGSGIAGAVARISLIPQAMLFLWALTFVVMTMSRRPSTPGVASLMIAIWAVLSIGGQIATRYVIAQDQFVLSSQATILPYAMLEIALAAAFRGYMSDGRRPNIFFLTRIRV